MIENKKGLSAVLGTLLIVLLVIIAVGIIWVVIRGIIETGAEELDLGARCLDVSVKATAVDCSSGSACDVTLYREAGGGAIDGMKIVITDGSNSYIQDESGNIEELDTRVVTGIDPTGGDVAIADIESVEIAVYFKDASGEAQLCSGTHTFVDIGLP